MFQNFIDEPEFALHMQRMIRLKLLEDPNGYVPSRQHWKYSENIISRICTSLNFISHHKLTVHSVCLTSTSHLLQCEECDLNEETWKRQLFQRLNNLNITKTIAAQRQQQRQQLKRKRCRHRYFLNCLFIGF